MSRGGKILIVVGIVLAVVILIPVIRHYQLRFAVESYVAELKAKGEPMELAQVIPPPVPPEQNGVPFITNAFANLKSESIAGSNTPPAMRAISPGKAMIRWQQPDIVEINWATNTWNDLGRELAAAKTDLQSFQSLSNHPALDFFLDYQKVDFSSLLPQLAPLKRSAQWLSASALYKLHVGDEKSACADICALLAIAKGEANERILISQLVRIAIASIGAGATWEFLQNPNIQEGDLVRLQQDWRALNFVGPLEQTEMFDQAYHLKEIAQIRNSSEKFDKLWGYFYSPNPDSNNFGYFFPLEQRSLFLRRWDELRWQWFWSVQDDLQGLQSFQVALAATRMAETNQSYRSVQSFATAGLKLDQNVPEGLRNIFVQSANASYSALQKVIRIETARNMVVTAISLKRFELRHRQLPATLEELTPDLLKTIPIDIMDGQPLRYRRNADGTFLLYSVGENGVDDGGNPALEPGVTSSSYYWQNPYALDWVWPQPATAAEIQKYYEEQAKKSK